MTKTDQSNRNARTFQPISEAQLDDIDRQDYLFGLGRNRGLTWPDLLKSKRVMIVSEAGAGKTYECQTMAQKLRAEGKTAFFTDLTSLARDGLRSTMDHVEEGELDNWLCAQDTTATFFLDSIDELALSKISYSAALKKLAKEIHPGLGRARIVVTSRPVPFDRDALEELLPIPKALDNAPPERGFAEFAVGEQWAPDNSAKDGIVDEPVTIVALLPLSDDQILGFAERQGVDKPEEMLADLRTRNAEAFARRPQDLIELCADWKIHERIRSHQEQVDSNIITKLQPARDREERCGLSLAKARDGASRLALFMIVTRRLTIRHDANNDEGSDEAAVEPSMVLADWTRDEVMTLLERPLFGFANYGRVRFHHRSVAEYLAAERIATLNSLGMTNRAIHRLTFVGVRGETTTRPSKRPIAAWLALKNTRVFEILRDNDPVILFREGDPQSLSIPQRSQVLFQFAKRYGPGGWQGLSVENIQLHRFADPALSHTVKEIWITSPGNHEMREVLLLLILHGRMADCATIAKEALHDGGRGIVERIYALDALIALDDPIVDDLSKIMAADPQDWPNELARIVLVRLFPIHISATDLVTSLGRVGEKPGAVTGVAWQLAREIEHNPLDEDYLEDFGLHLNDLIVKTLSPASDEDRHGRSHHGHLNPVLAALAVKKLERLGKSAPLEGWSDVLANVHTLRRDDNRRDDVHARLSALMNEMGAGQNASFIRSLHNKLQIIHGDQDDFDRFYRIFYRNGGLSLKPERDLEWMLAVIADPAEGIEYAATILEAALRLPFEKATFEEHGRQFLEPTRDRPRLHKRVQEWVAPRKKDRSLLNWEKKEAQRKEHNRKRHAKALANWVQFYRLVANEPDKAFSENLIENTLVNLWKPMGRAVDDDGASGWNRNFLETHFDAATVDRIRTELMNLWRKHCPSLPSERPSDERASIYQMWRLGLAGLHAEAEEPGWVEKLNADEVQCALRYMNVEISGYPKWLEDLTMRHPQAVDELLGKELSWELAHEATPGGSYFTLRSIVRASPESLKIYMNRIIASLEAWNTRRNLRNEDADPDQSASHGQIDPASAELAEIDREQIAMDAVVKHGSDDDITRLRKVILARLEQLKLSHAVKIHLITILLRLDPSAGVTAIEAFTKQGSEVDNKLSENIFGSMFGDGRHGVNLRHRRFQPETLERLLQLAYDNVKPEDDETRNGVYTPDARDHAERGRNQILDAILSSTGEQAWQVKQRMMADRRYAHFKDRILAIAREGLAKEADTDVLSAEEALILDKAKDMPITSNTAMFELMRDRLAEIDDLLLSDISPRETWAVAPTERALRREVARELHGRRDGIYTVDQEGVTADEKETDIRLRTPGSAFEGTIELKLVAKRSANDLIDTIGSQLVKKYMGPTKSRAGILLLSIAEERQWKHPQAGETINMEELITLLETEAKRIIDETLEELHLGIHILDLRPRLAIER